MMGDKVTLSPIIFIIPPCHFFLTAPEHLHYNQGYD